MAAPHVTTAGVAFRSGQGHSMGMLARVTLVTVVGGRNRRPGMQKKDCPLTRGLSRPALRVAAVPSRRPDLRVVAHWRAED